jgi:ketosteroid isomerase-like protein
MSQENVEAVHDAYAAMNTRDLRRVNELLDTDAEWISDRRVGVRPIRGREKVIEFFTDTVSVFGEIDFEIEQVWDRDDQVLVFLRVAGSGSASGAGFEIRIAHLWTLRNGKAVRGQGFGDRAEALEAAGLSE